MLRIKELTPDQIDAIHDEIGAIMADASRDLLILPYPADVFAAPTDVFSNITLPEGVTVSEAAASVRLYMKWKDLGLTPEKMNAEIDDLNADTQEYRQHLDEEKAQLQKFLTTTCPRHLLDADRRALFLFMAEQARQIENLKANRLPYAI